MEKFGEKGMVLQRSLIIGLGWEGALMCHELYERILNLFGVHPPVLRYLVIAGKEEIDYLVNTLRRFPKSNDFFHLLPVSMASGDIKQVVSDTRVQNWLPVTNVDELPPNPLVWRAAARSWLFRNQREVQRQLRESRQALMHGIALGEMQREGIQIRDAALPNYYLVGSLGNNFTSGILVDLAYLILHDASRRRPGEETSLGTACHSYGIFLLPGFPDDASLPVKDLRSYTHSAIHKDNLAQTQITNEWSWPMACAYAGIKELDFYMRGHPYRCIYPGNLQIAFAADHRPFQDGMCYLLSSEGTIGLTINDAIHSVADWLAFRTVSRVTPQLEGIGAGLNASPYGSFGVSSWILPRRALVEYCADRLTVDLVEQAIFSISDKDPDSPEMICQELGISVDAARRLLRSREGISASGKKPSGQDADLLKFIERIGETPEDLERIPLLDSNRFESELLKHDVNRRRYLDRIRGRFVDQYEQRRIDLAEKLRQKTETMLDDTPRGSLDRVQRTFRDLRGKLRQEKESLDEECQTVLKRIEIYTRKIEGQLTVYRWGIALFGVHGERGIPVTPVWMGGLVLLLNLVMFFILGQSMGLWMEFVALVGLSTLSLASIFVSWQRYFRGIRSELLSLVAKRQELDFEYEILVNLSYLWGELHKFVDQEILDGIQYLTGNLYQVLRDSKGQMDQTEFTQKLLGSPRYALEKSVLTNRSVEQFYREITFDSPDDLARDLIGKTMPLAQWIPQDIAQLRKMITEYAQQRLSMLDTYTVVRLLEMEADNDDQLGRQLNDRFRMANPMITLAQKDASSEQVEESWFTYISEKASDSKVWQSLQKIEGNKHELVSSHNPDLLAHIAVRRAVPLSNMSAIDMLSSEYNDFRTSHGIRYLHTTKRSLFLSDSFLQPLQAINRGKKITPLDRIEEISQIFALARYLEFVSWDQASECFAYWVKDDTARWLERDAGSEEDFVQIRLGTTPEESAYHLYLEETIRRELLIFIKQRIQEKIKELEGSWARLAGELRRYQREKGDLTEWEHETIDEFIGWIRTYHGDLERQGYEFSVGRPANSVTEPAPPVGPRPDSPPFADGANSSDPMKNSNQPPVSAAETLDSGQEPVSRRRIPTE